MIKTAFIAIHSITVIWLLAAAVYTYIVVFIDFKELYKESKVKS